MPMQAIEVRNPRTGEIDYRFTPPDAEALRARGAELRAQQAQWWRAGMTARIEVLRRWAEHLDRDADELAGALVTDTGRYGLALGEIAAAGRNIRRWCERAMSGAPGNWSKSPRLAPCNRMTSTCAPFC